MLTLTTYANIAPYYIYQASTASPANVGAVQTLPAAWLGGNATTTAISNLPARKAYIYSMPVYSISRLSTSVGPATAGNIVSITGKRRGVHPLAGVNWQIFGPPNTGT